MNAKDRERENNDTGNKKCEGSQPEKKRKNVKKEMRRKEKRKRKG